MRSSCAPVRPHRHRMLNRAPQCNAMQDSKTRAPIPTHAQVRDDLRWRVSARVRSGAAVYCGDPSAAVSATPAAGPSATAPTLSPPGGTAARRSTSLHSAWPARPGHMCYAALICAMPRAAVWNAVQPSRIAAQTATTAPQIILGSRPSRRARPWRPSRAQICTVAVRSTRTTPPGASGTQSAASSTGTRTGVARATRSRSRCAPVRRNAPHCVPLECVGAW
jgi:hypothetical protein